MNDRPILTLAIFLLTYAGIAVGSVPGLAIDRTGLALLGAVAMVAAGALSLPEAVRAIDAPTILLLFGFMIVSSQLQLSGFYARVAERLGGLAGRPRRFLLFLMLAAALLSAGLVNDIVCLAFTPVVIAVVRRAGLNPLPFLLGLAASSNIGSAATLVGNPQNMLVGQLGRIPFGPYLAWSAVPAALSLAVAYALLVGLYCGRWTSTASPRPDGAEAGNYIEESQPLDRHQARKGLIVAALVMALFFTRLPRETVALTAGACLLCSRRMTPRNLLGQVDWHLVILFCGLFVVIQAIETTGMPVRALGWLDGRGISIANPWAMLGIASGLSNLVSNVPATMLLAKFLDPAAPGPWYVLAAASTLAGNLITVGSIANLIVIEGARRRGIGVSFREHARFGIPLTLLSLGVLALWLLLAPPCRVA